MNRVKDPKTNENIDATQRDLIEKNLTVFMTWVHRLINTDTKAKCRHLKKLTCKGTLRQVYIIVYRLEIQSVTLVFSTQLCELLPLYPSLRFNSPPPLPVWISILYTRLQCLRGGEVLGLWQINTGRKVPEQVNFLDDDILHCLLWVFYRSWQSWRRWCGTSREGRRASPPRRWCWGGPCTAPDPRSRYPRSAASTCKQ